MSERRYHRAILASCVVPWDEKERLIEKLFRAEVRDLLKAGFRDLYIFGTAGEGHAVTREQFEEIVRVFAEETRGEGVFPQVGVIGMSTAQIVERIEFAHEAGFRVFQVSFPSWGGLNDTEVLRFFREVCGRFPDSKFLHYNLGRSQKLLTPADYRRLQGEIPNLAATKNTNPSVLHTVDLIRQADELQHFVGEATLPVGAMHGECSLLVSFGTVIPGATFRLWRHILAEEWQEAFLLHKEIMAAFLDTLGPMRAGVWMDGAYDKVWARLAGIEMPLRLLAPYNSFPESVVAECRAILEGKYGQLRAH